MNQFRLEKVQQHAIQARLNYFLGAEEYDRLFTILQVLHIEDAVLTVSVQPACVREVQDKYSWHIAIVAEELLKQAIRRVNVVPGDQSSSSGTQ
jgi:hypothetical protein